VDDPGKDGNASMPEQVKRPNPWKKMMMMKRDWKFIGSLKSLLREGGCFSRVVVSQTEDNLRSLCKIYCNLILITKFHFWKYCGK
jgi:hypothetical protein